MQFIQKTNKYVFWKKKIKWEGKTSTRSVLQILNIQQIFEVSVLEVWELLMLGGNPPHPLAIPIWQRLSPHAKHLAGWHPAAGLMAGQTSRQSLMCRAGMRCSSAFTLNNWY